MIRSWTALVLLVGGCSSGGPSPGDAAPPPDLAGAVADAASAPPDGSGGGDLATSRPPGEHPLLPTVTGHGGPVLASMQLWTVVWPGDAALGAQLDQFHGELLTSDYWTTIGGEYGVGPGAARGVIELSTPAPATLDAQEIESLVPEAIATGRIALDANTALMFLPPPTTVVTAGGDRGCTDFAGFHTQTSTGIPYQTVLRCQGFDMDTLTFVSSHEAIESATDPLVASDRAFFSDQLASGEVSDLCSGLATRLSTGTQAVVVRSWSQRVAAVGNADPCLPAPIGPWFNAGTDPLVTTVARGATATLRIVPFAEGEVGPITWRLQSRASGVTFTPASGTNAAGDTITVEVAVSPTTPTHDYPLIVEATAGSTAVNAWSAQLTVQ